MRYKLLGNLGFLVLAFVGLMGSPASAIDELPGCIIGGSQYACYTFPCCVGSSYQHSCQDWCEYCEYGNAVDDDDECVVEGSTIEGTTCSCEGPIVEGR